MRIQRDTLKSLAVQYNRRFARTSLGVVNTFSGVLRMDSDAFCFV